MFKFGLILICLFIFSCNTENRKVLKKEKHEAFNEQCLAITLLEENKNRSLELSLNTSSHMSIADFKPLYIGEMMDSIKIHTFLVNHDLNGIRYDMDSLWLRSKRKEFLEIYIDTTRFIQERIKNHHLNKSTGGKIDTFFSRYPLFIKNFSHDKHLDMGSGNYMFLLIEALDSNDNWRTIQKPFTYVNDCTGIEASPFILKPNELALSSVELFSGNYHTKFRVRYKNNRDKDYLFNDAIATPNLVFSNSFWGYMNYNQFFELKNANAN